MRRDDPRHLRPYPVEWVILALIVLMFAGIAWSTWDWAEPQACWMPEDLR